MMMCLNVYDLLSLMCSILIHYGSQMYISHSICNIYVRGFVRGFVCVVLCAFMQVIKKVVVSLYTVSVCVNEIVYFLISLYLVIGVN